MANAVFSSSVSYTPSGGGSLTQGFRVTFDYTASVSATLDVAVDSDTEIDIQPLSVGDVLGFVLRNNTDKALEVKSGANALYKVAPGGMVMHWNPTAPGAFITSLKVKPGKPTKAGTIEYIVLGN